MQANKFDKPSPKHTSAQMIMNYKYISMINSNNTTIIYLHVDFILMAYNNRIIQA